MSRPTAPADWTGCDSGSTRLLPEGGACSSWTRPHFVFWTSLCCLWSLTQIFVKAASGRQRFNVLGAWNAVTRELVTITNSTVVNTETTCALLRVVAAVQDMLDRVPTTHAEKVASLLTLEFQEFDIVSFLAA